MCANRAAHFVLIGKHPSQMNMPCILIVRQGGLKLYVSFMGNNYPLKAIENLHLS